MTTIITRLYADAEATKPVVAELLAAGHPQENIDVITKDGESDKASVTERMKAARVGNASAAAYADQVENGKALLVARAEFNPIGSALGAIRIVDRYESFHVGGATPDEYLTDRPRRRPSSGGGGGMPDQPPSILPDHPRFLTKEIVPPGKPVSASWGLPLVLADRPHTSAIRGGALISTKILPFPLLSASRKRSSAIPGGAFMSSRILPFPLLSPSRKRASVIPGGGTPLSSMLSLPLLVKRR